MNSAFSLSSLDVLVRAADFVERRETKDREADHGYASTIVPMRIGRRNSMSHKGNHSKLAHNELEKSRRAHLHSCLETLKAVVPLQSNTSRHTTLGLLINARRLIKQLQDFESDLMTNREQLIMEQGRLRRRIDACQRQYASYRDNGLTSPFSYHSLSESSTTSTSTSASSAAGSPTEFFELCDEQDVDLVFGADDLADEIEEVDSTYIS